MSKVSKKTGKRIIVTNEYIMKNRYLTRMMAMMALIFVIIFASIYVYDKFIVNHSCFTFYLEVKDRDLQTRILSDREVRDRIDEVCIKYNTGYTIWVGQGGYVDDDKKVHTEDTYILRINNLTPTIADDIANSFIEAVNSTACMVEENRSKAKVIAIN